MRESLETSTKLSRFLHLLGALVGAALFVLICMTSGCGRSLEKSEALAQTLGDLVIPLSPIAFAETYRIPYRGMSATQLDTVCVDLAGEDVSALRATLDLRAAEVGERIPEFSYWYLQYAQNNADYVNHCLSSAFPVTFVSARTGETHTVSSYVQCRAETSDVVATEYVTYLRGGGRPVSIAAKLKTTGCSGSAPYLGRIQSVHGSMIDDYRAIGLSYP